jgi:hypothetical protein
VETGDSGEIVATPDVLQGEITDSIKRSRGLDVHEHARNFFECMRTRGRTVANEDVMRKSHIACHAAAIAWILKRKLTIDPEKEAFVNDSEANQLRSRPFRNWQA